MYEVGGKLHVLKFKRTAKIALLRFIRWAGDTSKLVVLFLGLDEPKTSLQMSPTNLDIETVIHFANIIYGDWELN